MSNKNYPSYPYWNFRARQRQLEVDVEMSASEWRIWWEETGKWHQRGPKPDDWCMARIDKTQGFSIDNIKCIQNKYNKIKHRK